MTQFPNFTLLNFELIQMQFLYKIAKILYIYIYISLYMCVKAQLKQMLLADLTRTAPIAELVVY